MENELPRQISLERSLERKERRGIRLKSYRRFPRELPRKKICRIGTSSGYQNNDTWYFTMAKKYSCWD
jgi:hypothetical protein